MNFANLLHFFKNILDKHWISLKAAPIAIPVNASNTGHQKRFVLFNFSRSAYGKYEDISIETFIKVFVVP